MTSGAKDKQWKRVCDTLNRDTTLIHSWKFYRRMKGCVVSTTTLELIDVNGALMKTNEERAMHYSEASFTRAIRTIWTKRKQSGEF